MTNFTFETTPTLICRSGSVSRLGEAAGRLGCSRIMIVTDPGIVAAGLVEPATEILKAVGIDPVIHDDVTSDPPEALVLAAIKRAQDEEVDGIVGLGGGSAMDTAKLVALLSRTDQDLDDIYGIALAKGPRYPLILMPTTAGTGSEVTPIAIVTTRTDEKKGVVSPFLLPDMAILDPELTISVPQNVTAAAGIDAMVHAIEAYTSRHKKNIMSDMLAKEALGLLGGAIETACLDGHNIKARTDMLLGATLAGMAFANAPVAAVHALAYPLGGHFHVPHGLSNSLMLPHVLAFNAPDAAPLYADVANILLPNAEGTSAEKTAKLIRYFSELAPRIGLPTRLTDVGISHNQLPMLAEDAMKQTRVLVNNPREVTEADALALYEAAL